MTYILLVAGKGSRLHPLTLSYPKSLYKLDEDTSVLKRMVSKIKKFDSKAEIIVVVGFSVESIKKEIDDVIFIHNPFYECTNSIASLWFAREYLSRDNVTVINGDIVMSEELTQKVLCVKTDKPIVLMDSSIRTNGDYNVQVSADQILVMSKNLEEYAGEYAGVTKLDFNSAKILKNEVEIMVNEKMYDQWYENALVNMIFKNNFHLFYEDICNYQWTEVDSVNDMLLAKKIHLKENI